MAGISLYFPVPGARYNGATREKSGPVQQTLLDTLQAQHADSFGWALACCGWQRGAAEDVLQEAYLRALDGRARFNGRSQPRTWFFGVIKRVAAEQHRGSTRRSMLKLRLAHAGSVDAPGVDDTPGDALYRDQSVRELQQAMMKLAQRQREVLHLAFYAELTLQEVAAVLGISVGSARTHYQRGKERLSQLLTQGD